jgi:hypothetical protein
MKSRPSINGSAATPANAARQIMAPIGELWTSAWAVHNKALLSPLISTERNGLRGHQATRFPGSLRLHPAFNDLNLSGWLINSELQGKPQSIHEPILIAKSDILIAGFAEWHAAVCAGQLEIDCVEFALNDDEALQLILTLQRPRAAWNEVFASENGELIVYHTCLFAHSL